MIYEKMLERRSIRRFQQKPVPEDLLDKYVNAARLAPTARNLQPLEFIIVFEPEINAQVFETITWGGFAPDGKIEDGSRATAYIVILVNKQIRDKGYDQDVGLAAGNAILAAQESGLGSVCLRAVDWNELRNVLSIPETHEPVLIIALGYPNEKAVAEDTESDKMDYYKDETGTLHVPKRKLERVIHRNKF